MGAQGTVRDWRRDLQEILTGLRKGGFSHVQWITAGDEHVCASCQARSDKVYSIQEARREIQGRFCTPGDPDDRCRCTFVPHEIGQHSQTAAKGRVRRGGCAPVVLAVVFLIIVIAVSSI